MLLAGAKRCSVTCNFGIYNNRGMNAIRQYVLFTSKPEPQFQTSATSNRTTARNNLIYLTRFYECKFEDCRRQIIAVVRDRKSYNARILLWSNTTYLEELIYDACTFIDPNLQTRLLESTKLRPVTVTAVPPVKMPFLGVMSYTRSCSRYVNCRLFEIMPLSTYRMTKITRPIGDGGAIHAP